MSQVAKTDSGQIAPVSAAVEEWELLLQASTEFEGYSLYGGKENDNTLDSLIGVPFVLLNATFREGDIIPDGKKFPRDYVSCEVLISPAHARKFNRSHVVFNDGSTGIYRDVVRTLLRKGYITGLNEELPENGDANTTRYDVSFSRDTGEAVRMSTSFDGINLYCPEGLRKSDYKGPKGDATTWYLA